MEGCFKMENEPGLFDILVATAVIVLLFEMVKFILKSISKITWPQFIFISTTIMILYHVVNL